MTYHASGKAVPRRRCRKRTQRRIDRVSLGSRDLRLRLSARRLRHALPLCCCCLLARRLPFAQALPNINSLSVRYNSQKTAAKAEGELKAQLDEVDKAIADARRAGNIGEVRRQIAKGMALLNKDAWTPAARLPAFAGAAQRAHGDRFVGAVCVPHRADLPAVDRADAGAHDEGVDSQARTAPARPGAPATPPAPPRELGTFDGVSRDLRESPFAIELDLAGIEDGALRDRGGGVRRHDVARHGHAWRVPPQGPRRAG